MTTSGVRIDTAAQPARTNRSAVYFGIVTAAFALSTSDASGGLLSWTSVLYRSIGSLRLTPADLIILIGMAASVVEARRARMNLFEVANVREGRLAALLAFALALAICQGFLLGYSQHVAAALVDALPALYLVGVPWFAAYAVGSDGTTAMTTQLLMVFGVTQAIVGLLNVALGLGPQAGTTVLADKNAGPILVMLIAGAVAAVTIVRRPRNLFALMTLLLTVAAIVLSQRRSFDIALAVSALVIAAWALTIRRSLALPVAGLAIAALTLFVVSGHTPSIVDTGQSGHVSTVHTPVGDEYRLLERRNVIATLEHHPIAGLGFGVPWVQSKPLPGYFVGYLQYTHVGYLWWWLKTGLLGVLTYLATVLLALWCAMKSALSDDHSVHPLSVAVVCGLVADLTVEATASFSGSDPQYTYILAMLIGLALALRLNLARKAKDDRVWATNADA